MSDAVAVSDLVKRYRGNPRPAVDGLSFTVAPGEVFGLLGPNGAGKTTTVGVLTTRVLPTGGRALMYDVDVVADPQGARKLLAVVPQRVNLDRSLNARQNLIFHAAYHGVPRVERGRRADEILAQMGLAEHRKAMVDNLSGGQVQRLMIARALMHQPKVMFLDEPSTGLDPQARLFVHDRIAGLGELGVTVVLTTHDMDEAAKLCDRVGIVDHGKLLALDTPAALTRSLPGSTSLNLTINLGGHTREAMATALAELDGVRQVEPVSAAFNSSPSGAGGGFPGGGFPGGGFPGGGMGPGLDAGASRSTPAVTDAMALFRLYTDIEPATVLPAVLRVVADLGCAVTDLAIGQPSLEDTFIRLTGRELR